MESSHVYLKALRFGSGEFGADRKIHVHLNTLSFRLGGYTRKSPRPEERLWECTIDSVPIARLEVGGINDAATLQCLRPFDPKATDNKCSQQVLCTTFFFSPQW